VSAGRLADQNRRGRLVWQNDLIVRLASAAILLGIALGAAYFGGLIAGAVVAIFAAVVLHEWTMITGRIDRWLPFAIVVAGAIVVASAGMLFVAVALAAIAVLAAGMVAREGWLPAGVLYSNVFGISLIAIRATPEYGFAALFFVLGIVWATDSGAFFAGRLIGGPKLWPSISPKKTWAGAVGGLVLGALAGIVAAALCRVPIATGLISVAVGLSIFCQIGDLFESWVKRRFDAKDSGSIIPGHGGIMDRVDGLTFSAMAAVLIGAGHGGSGDLGRGLLIW
jgi:phosphatidate cytidylyltransferase